MSENPLIAALIKRRYLVLLLLGTFLYLPFLGIRELWYPDEPCVGEVTKAMFDSGDWIVPRRVGEKWVDYWPLLYWAGSATSFLLGGISEFSLRLVSALSGLAMVLASCAAASRWFGARAGFWTGLCLLTFHHFVENSTAFRPDLLFAVMITGGMLAYAEGAGAQPRWGSRILGFALLGGAVLVKGPLGLLLPGLVLTLWHLWRREWRRILAMAPLTLVALAVALPWAFACADAGGSEWFWGEIWAQNFDRFGTDVGRGHIHPWHYYLTRLIWNLAPWSLLLPFALWWLWKSPLRQDRYGQLALWWFGTVFVFLSLAETKREMYMIPAYTPIAMILGAYLAPIGRGEAGAASESVPRVYSKVWGTLLVVVGLLLMMVDAAKWPVIESFDLVQKASINGQQLQAFSNLDWLLALSGLFTLLIGIWIRRGSRAEDPLIGPARLGLGVIGVYAFYWALILPATAPFKDYSANATWVRAHVGGQREVGMFFPYRGYLKREAFGYYAGLHCKLLGEYDEEGDIDSLTRFLKEHPGSVVLVESKSAEKYGLWEHSGNWRQRIVRELPTGGKLYYVIR